MGITQDISQITPLSAFTSPNRPAEVDNLVENELPVLTQELRLLIPQINETENQMNVLKTQTENVNTTASSDAAIATQKASEANNSANQALTYKNQIQSYVIPAGTSYSVDQSNTQNSAMTKAQFNALAEERKANRAGSGFDEMGKHHATVATYPNINEGMYTFPTVSNIFNLGRQSSTGTGVSKTELPILNMNGIRQLLKSIGTGTATENTITVPTASNIYPYDTVLTAEQIASGVIKHADASNSGLVVNGKGLSGTTYSQTVTVVNGKKYIIEYKDNGVRKTLEITASSTSYIISLTGTNITEVGMYPLDAISRSDLVFLESWHEDISEKNFVYPLGNVQYLGANTDGLTGIANGAFTGFETYSLFGNWQTSSALIGKGYVWSSLTEAQKKAFIANPDNNCYLDGDKTIQVRYRMRVVQGLGDSWGNVDTQLNGSYTNLNYASSFSVSPKGKLVNTNDYANNDSYRYWGAVGVLDTLVVSNNKNTGAFTSRDSSISTFSYEKNAYALPIALVHRRNQGMYHPVYNANGSKKASDGNFWYNTAVNFTSISDCFDPAKLLTASGYIGTVSGRPNGLFYDQVHESDILDLRNNSKKVEDYSRLREREFNKLVAGTNRGKEAMWEFYSKSDVTLSYGNYLGGINTNSYLIQPNSILPITQSSYKGICIVIIKSGANAGKLIKTESINIDANYFQLQATPSPIRFTDGSIVPNLTGIIVDIIFARQTTRTKSNTLLHCDIIGNPTNYPTSWKESAVFGTPLIVAEDGTSLLPDGARDSFKLSKKANTTPLLCLRSTDNGVTWTSFTPTFSTTTNAITLTDEPAGNLVMVYYQTHTSMAVPVTNSEIIEYGKVLGTDGLSNSHFISTLIGKVPTANTAPYLQDGYNVNAYRIDSSTIKWSTTSTEIPTHTALSLAGGASGVPAVKVFPYLTRFNGKAYLNLVFKEMKHNGTSWGDDAKFNIVDNVSTTTDNNAQTVLIGQKTIELPYFIAGDE